MWCRSCQQEVPGVTSSDASTVRCARCQSALASRAGSNPREALGSAAAGEDRGGERAERAHRPQPPSPHGTSPTDYGDLEEDLWAADQLFRELGLPPDESPPPAGAGEARHAWSPPRPPSRERRPGGRWPSAGGLAGLLARLAFALGLMGLAFGAGLLGRWALGDRPDLWQLGMLASLAGQAALLLGVVLHLESRWRRGGVDSAAPWGPGGKLPGLQQAMGGLAAAEEPTGHAFHRHPAESSRPHLWPGDLGGQGSAAARGLSGQA